ncbi:MAG: hypothetical protein IPM35_00100 [Myxococcales bacterium]|nr:hypothetical protein [Myxococcales bacterium]
MPPWPPQAGDEQRDGDAGCDAQPVERVTLLQCADDLIATKHVRLDAGNVVVTRSSDKITYWAWTQVEVDGIHLLSELLSQVALEPRVCIIRGEPLPGIPSAGVRRCSNHDTKTGEAPTFTSVERRWVAFDFDRVELSEEVDLVTDPEHAIRVLIRENLPPAFHGVTCHWTLSASAAPGRTRVINARPWFWLDRPVSDAELKAWADAHGVPPSVKALFQAVQLHYVAAPRVEGQDWIPRRFGLLVGERDTVTLPPTPYVEVEHPLDDGPRPDETPELIAQAVAHLSTLPPHAPGTNLMWHAALTLARGFALSEETTFQVLRDHYDPRCEPPWGDDAKLQHKAEDAVRASKVPLGYLTLCSCRACDAVTGGVRPVTQEMLAKYAKQLSKSRSASKSELGELLLKVAKGEPFADSDPRRRDDAIERLSFDLSTQFRGYSVQSVAKLFETSLAKMKEQDPNCPGGEVVLDRLRGAQKKQRGVCITTDIPAMTDAALDMLAKDGRYMQHGNTIVRVARTTKPAARIKSDEEVPVLEPAPFAAVREAVGKAKWFAPSESGEGKLKPALPPDFAIQALMARGDWPPLPNVDYVSECPVLRADGTIASAPGYDEASGAFIVLNDDYPAVPEHPTREHVQAAIAAIDDVLYDFPFEAPEHRGAVFAAILTLLGRETFEDPPPLFMVEATKKGSGKDKLVKLIGIIGTGRQPFSASFSENDEAMQKLITSVGIGGIRLVNFANVTGTFGGANLCKALTESHWGDRVLGVSKYWTGLLSTVWFATSNNPTIGTDMDRRICPIRLDWGRFGIADPHMIPAHRWRHKDVIRYVVKNRAKLVCAGLTILRYYFANRAPEQETSDWGSYEPWARSILGALVFAGLPDPGPAREPFAQRSNFEENQKQQFVSAFTWFFEEVAEKRPMLASEILAYIHARRPRPGVNQSCSPPSGMEGSTGNQMFHFDFDAAQQYDVLTEALQALSLADGVERMTGIGSDRKATLPSATAFGKQVLSPLNGALFDITSAVQLPEPPSLLVEAQVVDAWVKDPATGALLGWKFADGGVQWSTLSATHQRTANGAILTQEKDSAGNLVWLEGVQTRVLHYPEARWRRGPTGGIEMLTASGWIPQPRIQVRIVPFGQDRNKRNLWGVERVEMIPAQVTS